MFNWGCCKSDNSTDDLYPQHKALGPSASSDSLLAQFAENRSQQQQFSTSPDSQPVSPIALSSERSSVDARTAAVAAAAAAARQQLRRHMAIMRRLQEHEQAAALTQASSRPPTRLRRRNHH